MSITITKTIKDCHSCRHLDHSGSYTPGGAKWICGHSDAADMVTQAKGLRVETREEMREWNKTGKFPDWFRHHWKYRVLPDEGKTIPDWCPLKHGKGY